MNSKQRRKAYRAMPKAGTAIAYRGGKKTGFVVGPMNVYPLQFNNERGNKRSVHRLRIKTPSGAHVHLLRSQYTA